MTKIEQGKFNFYVDASNAAYPVKKKEDSFDSTIPVVDMLDFYNPSQRGIFIQGLKEAFQKYGFVAVVNANLPQEEVLDSAYKTIIEFFKQPLEKKLEIKSKVNSGERGYVNSESAKGQNSTVTDYKEFIHIGRELTPEQAQRLQYPENLWPQDFELKGSIIELYRSLEGLVTPFSEAISEAMGMPTSFLSSMTHDGDHLLRTVHYPANPPEGEYWAAEHTDINLFTLLPRATSEGLQLKLDDGTWMDVTVPKGAILMNVGDMLQNLTNGLFRSSVHRVEAKVKGEERFSIVLFAHAHRDDRMDPLPGCIEATGGRRKYPLATRQQLLEQRIVEMGRASVKMMKDLYHSGLLEQQEQLGIDCSKAREVMKKYEHIYN